MTRSVSNPPNPWLSTHIEWLAEPPAARLSVFEENARSALSSNDSPDIPFRYSVNPYRGCQHACAYCYARPTHEFLDLGAGTDFDKHIIVKTNIVELLRRQLARKSWRRETVTFSGVTDCYQALEASYALTAGCLTACLEARTPVAVITKSALVQRDTQTLQELATTVGARVFFSIPFLDPAIARALEPGAPCPTKRFQAMAHLAEAGIPVGISIAPLIPGLNDSEIPALLTRAREAGARTAFMTLLYLSPTVEGIFRSRLRARLPHKVDAVFGGLSDMRGGRTTESRFDLRMRGTGARWSAIHELFHLLADRLGLETVRGDSLEPLLPPGNGAPPGNRANPAPRGEAGQLELFA